MKKIGPELLRMHSGMKRLLTSLSNLFFMLLRMRCQFRGPFNTTTSLQTVNDFTAIHGKDEFLFRNETCTYNQICTCYVFDLFFYKFSITRRKIYRFYKFPYERDFCFIRTFTNLLVVATFFMKHCHFFYKLQQYHLWFYETDLWYDSPWCWNKPFKKFVFSFYRRACVVSSGTIFSGWNEPTVSRGTISRHVHNCTSIPSPSKIRSRITAQKIRRWKLGNRARYDLYKKKEKKTKERKKHGSEARALSDENKTVIATKLKGTKTDLPTFSKIPEFPKLR